MDIKVTISNLETDIRSEILSNIRNIVNKELERIDVKDIIQKEIIRQVGVSKTVSEKHIKDFVRERIAKIITIDFLKEEK